MNGSLKSVPITITLTYSGIKALLIARRLQFMSLQKGSNRNHLVGRGTFNVIRTYNLSIYVWEMKTKQKETPQEMIRLALAYLNIMKQCLLCLHGNFLIVTYFFLHILIVTYIRYIPVRLIK